MSNKQVEANRENSLQSASPRAAEGVEVGMNHKRFVESVGGRSADPSGFLV
jgi:hypothetical protein